MRRSASLLTSVLSLAVLGFASFADAQSLVSRGIPTAAALDRFGLEAVWRGQAVLNPSRDRVAHLALDEDLVYVQGSNGVLTAFDAETGQRMWAIQLGRYDESSFAPVTNEDTVMTVIGPTLFGISKRSGDLLWQIRLPGAPSTGPSADELHVYVGMLDGSVYAFSLKKIRQLYLERRLPAWSYETIVWRYQAAEEITSPPITTARSANFASRDKSLYAVSKDRRELIYQFETDAPIVAPLAQVGNTQFLASEDFNFYAINADNGTVKWEFVTGLPIRKAPIAIGKSLFVLPDRGGMYNLDVETGDQRWWQPTLTQFVSLLGNMLVARDDDLNLVMLEADTGRLIGRLPARHYSRHLSNVRNDRVYVASDAGEVLALREIGKTYPTYHQYPERRPILPEIAPEEPEPPMPGDTTPPADQN